MSPDLAEPSLQYHPDGSFWKDFMFREALFVGFPFFNNRNDALTIGVFMLE